MATRMQRNTQQQRGAIRGRLRARRSGQDRMSVDGSQFGVDDLTYDLITMLHTKSKGLEALGKYMKDAEDNDEVMELIQRIQEEDREQVKELKNCLADVIRNSAM